MSNQLRWITMAVATGVAALAMGQASAQNYGSTGNGNGYVHSRTIRCESNNSRRTWCRADTRGGVQVARQISHTACIEGSSWGSSDRGVWVSNGCRADFAINAWRDDHHHDSGYNNNGHDNHFVDNNGQILQCDSTGDGRTYCHSEPNRRFLLSRSRSGNCVEGRTWGSDERGLWVSGDCRGDFNYQH